MNVMNLQLVKIFSLWQIKKLFAQTAWVNGSFTSVREELIWPGSRKTTVSLHLLANLWKMVGNTGNTACLNLGVFRKPVRRTLYILSQTAKNWNFFLKTSFVTIQLLWKVVFCCFWIKKKFWKLSKTLFLQTKSFWECFFTNWKKMFKSC